MSPTIIPMTHENDLVTVGYSTFEPAKKRHSALRKAVEIHGALTVFRMLNAGSIRSKHHRRAHKVFENDKKWVGREYDVSSEPGFQFKPRKR